ncbi:MAG: protein kinase [Polyangiaceae bacterium]
MLSKPASGLILAGKYKLLEPIGSGGMSEVFRAENLVIGRNVAVKLLNPNHARDPSLTERFFQEARSASRIQHPAIVDVLDAGEGETGPYLVMELLEGSSAASVLSRFGKMDVAAALATAVPVLSALSAAHGVGVVHRDLKPENIFYHRTDDERPVVKLLDFGIAKLLSPAGPTPRTSTGIVFGTPDYLSPEQAAGFGEIDGRSDLFSVAVVVYELLTGVRPFHAPTTVATAYRIAHAKAPTLAENGGPDHPTLDAVLARALAKRPDERHQTAADLAAELAALVSEDERERALERLVGSRAMRTLESSGVHPTYREEPASLATPSAPRTDATQPSRYRSTPSARPARYSTPPFPRQPSVAPSSGLGAQASSVQRSARPSQPPAAVATSSDSSTLPSLDAIQPSSRPSGSMRISPQRLVANAHVRGVVFRSLDAKVVSNYGRPARDTVMSEVCANRDLDLVQNSVQTIVMYELDLVSAYVERVTRDLARGDASWCRHAGHDGVSGELATMFGHLSNEECVGNLLRRSVPLLSRLLDFGRWDVEERESAVLMRVSDFEAAPLGIRDWLHGVVAGLVASAHPPVATSIARGAAAFSPQLVVEVVPMY